MRKMNLPTMKVLCIASLCAIVAIAGMFTIAGCSNEPEDVLVTGVTLSYTTFSLVEGAEATLIATVMPDNASNKTVSWVSSNTGVATVDNNGKVTAVTAGETIITVTTEDGGRTDECAVTVTAVPIVVTGVTLDKTTLSLMVGGEETLKATVEPDNASNKTVSWVSSNTGVAMVDNNGKVTAVTAGEAIITVSTEDGDFTESCFVTVAVAIPVESISLNVTDTTLSLIDTLVLTATVYPATADNKEIAWSIDKEDLVVMDSDGKVTAIKDAEGTAVITATAQDGSGVTVACAVTVNVIGMVSFQTTTTWTVGDQIWSDVVVATGCRKESFIAVESAVYRADCRKSNVDYGNLFSWDAMSHYKEQLCPDGWRVPTPDDFCTLVMTLNDNAADCEKGINAALRNKLISEEWGGKYNGYAANNSHFQTNTSANYWSLNPDLPEDPTCLTWSYAGMVNANAAVARGNGFVMRCIKE